MDNKKLFVGNLPWGINNDSLRELFASVGEVVEAMVITDRMSGRSKGFGFVEMSTDEEAQKAIEMFDGKELDGRTVKVNEAKPMEPRAPRTGGGFGGGNRW